MKTQFESLGRQSVATPCGRLDFGAAASFQSELEKALAGGPSGMIIDCGGLDYVSSAGLRVFLLVSRAAKRAGVALAICNLNPPVKEVFDVSGFSQIITVCADRAAAVTKMPP
jgi:stage II sporulation protein AA (anti-sigma F factor antagonist)